MILPTENAIARVVIKRLGAQWFLGVLAATFGALYLVATTHGPNLDEQYLINTDRAFTLINIGALLLVTIVSATEIPYDISGRVLLVLLSKPIRRYQYITGKFLGLIAVGMIFALICSGVTAILLYIKFHHIDIEPLHAAAMICLRVVAIAGLATMLSASFTEVPTIAGCISAIIFSFGINMMALMLLKSEVSGAYKLIASPVLYLIPNLVNLGAPPSALADFVMGRQRDLSMVSDASIDALFEAQTQPLFFAFFYAVAYGLIFLGLGVLLFYRNERVE